MTKQQFLSAYFTPLFDDDDEDKTLCVKDEYVIRYNGDFIQEYLDGEMLVGDDFDSSYEFDSDFVSNAEVFKRI